MCIFCIFNGRGKKIEFCYGLLVGDNVGCVRKDRVMERSVGDEVLVAVFVFNAIFGMIAMEDFGSEEKL